jgi:hypothetical protein
MAEQIDPTLDGEDISSFYFECVNDQDVIDHDALLAVLSQKGLLLNVGVDAS